jgi:hypothetical protein
VEDGRYNCGRLMNGFRSAWYRIVVLLMTGLVLASVFSWGPGQPGFPLLVTGWTFCLDPVLIDVMTRFMPARWFRVPEAEHVLHRVLGIRVFARLIERAGWNDLVVRPLWNEAGYKPGTKASLEFRASAARTGGGAHAVCFGLHVLLAAAALVTRHPRAALWILLPGVVLHLYPTLLQRFILLRLQPLLERAPAAAAASPQ